MTTYAQVMDAQTLRGGWTRAQLASWGVSWPPRKGWITRLTSRSKPHSKPLSSGKASTYQTRSERDKIVAKAVSTMPDRLKAGKGLIAFFDGACWPNPHGTATCSATIQRDGVRIASLTLHVGTGNGMSNNVAEFAGVKLILDWLITHAISEPITICGDSLIAIKRMKSRTLPTGLCREYARTCLDAARKCKGTISYRWIPRELNTVCDELAGEVMQSHNGTSTTPLTVDEADCMSYVPAYLLNGTNDLPYWSGWEMTR